MCPTRSEHPAAPPLPLDGAARRLLDALPLRAALMDRTRRVVYANRALTGFAGLPRRGYRGWTEQQLVGDALWRQSRHLAAAALAGRPARWEGRVPSRRHGPRHVVRHYVPARARGGRILGYWIFVLDVTDRVETERRADATERLRAAIVDGALDCVIAIDEEGLVREWNPAAEATFGIARASMIGKPLGDVIVPERHRQAHASGFARYLAGGAPRILGRRVEIEALRANGEEFPCELAVSEVRLASGRIFVASLRDLTSVRAAEAELARQRASLVQAERMSAMGSLLAGVAHELNNPLSIVIGQAAMLAEATEGSPHAARAAKVQDAADRCARIVRTFLAMARQKPPRREPVSAEAIARAAIELLAYGLRSDGIEVTLDADPATPSLSADQDQLHQVLANLLTNAQAALRGRDGPRRIAVTVCPEGADVRIAVSDNGPGVAAAIAERVFEPFFTTKPVGQGTGIGLAVCRSIAIAHGGGIALESPPEGGARFVLRLPGSPLAVAEPEAQPQPARLRGRVLVVDDEPGIAEVVCDILRTDGWETAVAHDGNAAIATLAAERFDAVLSDVRMPGQDGIAVFHWIAAHRPGLAGRVVLMSGDVMGSAPLALPEAARLVEKPFEPAELRRVMASLT
ncbi:hybrid sensor histidine kinase/response regulator [Elioraea rosea]|uniref:hybrid sensor histidine kinase/response regulator n=1 Tax=Elioraea rosea TaxID=2492390 RepID=UPI0011833280|nr:PAS domain S-box protein [Elioraea rosea]